MGLHQEVGAEGTRVTSYLRSARAKSVMDDREVEKLGDQRINVLEASMGSDRTLPM